MGSRTPLGITTGFADAIRHQLPDVTDDELDEYGYLEESHSPNQAASIIRTARRRTA